MVTSNGPVLMKVEARVSRATTHVAPGKRRHFHVLVSLMPCSQTVAECPLDVRFVVDHSGSMGQVADIFAADPGDVFRVTTKTGRFRTPTPEQMLRYQQRRAQATKLEVVKGGLSEIVRDELGALDAFMLVVFDDQYTVSLPYGMADNTNKRAFLSALRDVQPLGSTQFHLALQAALEPHVQRGAQARLVLFTDGDSTVKPSEDREKVEHLAARACYLGIPLCVYATGVDYDFAWLEKIVVMAGSGSYLYHASNPTDLRFHLSGELAHLRGTALRNVSARFTTAAGIEIVEAWQLSPNMRSLPIDQSQRLISEGNTLDTFRGSQYFLTMEGQPDPGAHKILAVGLSATRVSDGAVQTIEPQWLSMGFTQDPSAQTLPDPQVLATLKRIEAYKAAREQRFKEAAAFYDELANHPSFGGTHDTQMAARMHALADLAKKGEKWAKDAHRTAVTMAGGGVRMPFTQGGK